MPFTNQRSLIFGLLAAWAAGTNAWVTFYSDDLCDLRSGSVSYDNNNDGIFQNGGAYIKCDEGTEWSMISYPPGDSAGDNPDFCHVFSRDEAAITCIHLPDLGFPQEPDGYLRVTLDHECPATSSKKRSTEKKSALDVRDVSTSSNEGQAGKEGRWDRRDASWLGFCDDPDCDDQSGSVHYSTNNAGCFENGGAYWSLTGDDDGCHIEQWSGVDNFACGDTMLNCVDCVSIPHGTPLHVDDYGFQSGFGSYKIGRGGCP